MFSLNKWPPNLVGFLAAVLTFCILTMLFGCKPQWEIIETRQRPPADPGVVYCETRALERHCKRVTRESVREMMETLSRD